MAGSCTSPQIGKATGGSLVRRCEFGAQREQSTAVGLRGTLVSPSHPLRGPERSPRALSVTPRQAGGRPSSQRCRCESGSSLAWVGFLGPRVTSVARGPPPLVILSLRGPGTARSARALRLLRGGRVGSRDSRRERRQLKPSLRGRVESAYW